jgi:hypothetical protein
VRCVLTCCALCCGMSDTIALTIDIASAAAPRTWQHSLLQRCTFPRGRQRYRLRLHHWRLLWYVRLAEGRVLHATQRSEQSPRRTLECAGSTEESEASPGAQGPRPQEGSLADCVTVVNAWWGYTTYGCIQGEVCCECHSAVSQSRAGAHGCALPRLLRWLPRAVAASTAPPAAPIPVALAADAALRW